MAFGRLWAGVARGTNTGKLFLELSGPDEELTGTLRFNEDDRDGIWTYSITGKFDGEVLELTGQHQIEGDGARANDLKAVGRLSSRGAVDGRWEADQDTGGTFTLFVQDAPKDHQPPDLSVMQLHTARWRFGAISIDREQIIRFAQSLQHEFKNGHVVVTVVPIGGSEQARFLTAFENLEFDKGERAEILKISVSEAEPEGTKRLIEIELGPQVNSAVTQSYSEAWALGRLEKVKNEFKKFERSYATHVKKLNFGVNQVIIGAALIYLPSMTGLERRAAFFLSILLLTRLITFLHRKYLPFTAIYLSDRKEGFLWRAGPSVVSWIIALTAGVAAALIGAFLQGALGLTP
ncbi:hypothetical protein [Thalassospira povalilytica]|uniref:hypothetical protein n=1 Tax=Thalassospira povalilytica TaxID=732237 RepID=UPI003AA95C0F